MKGSWIDISMNEACDLITCGVAARPNYVDEGIPFLSAKNVKNGEIVYSDYNCITLENHRELTKKNKPLPGDILYTRVGSFGEAAVIKKDIEFSVFVSLTLIKPKKDILNPFFLKHYLNSPKIKTLAKKSITSSGVGNLNVGTVRKFPVIIPPLSEQNQIVETLDKAFEKIDKAIANIERNIENAEELFKSKLNQIFSPNGDNLTEEPLAEVFLFSQGIQRSVKLQSEIMGEDQVRFLRIVDYTQGNEPPRYIDNPGNDYIVGVEDISLVRYGASTGFVCRGYDGALANNLFRVIPRENYTINLSYLYYYLLSPVFQGFIKRKMTGAAMPAISFSMIKNIPFKYLKVNTQQNIAETLNVMDNHIQSLLASYKKELKILEELKKSILEKAFKRELTSAA